MKFVLALCLVACLIASLQAAAVDTTTAQSKAADADTTVAPTAASDVIEECHQPKVTGRCFALFYRFAYNVENRQCEEFIYGGCNGNQNNFESKEACEKKCLPKADDEESTTTAKASDEASTTSAKEANDAQPVVPVVGVLPSVAA